jgi:vacuolar protein sorting-associated protein IST1
MKKLTNNMPSASLVEAYLTEIAKGYGVQWNPNLGSNQSDEVQGPAVSGYPPFSCDQRIG